MTQINFLDKSNYNVKTQEHNKNEDNLDDMDNMGELCNHNNDKIIHRVKIINIVEERMKHIFPVAIFMAIIAIFIYIFIYLL